MPEPDGAAVTDNKRQGRTDAIVQFLREFAPSDNEDLLSQMMVTICRLAADKTDRGELKILNSALKELRYAFKVFAPYAGVRKVSMFGSARTREDHPQYLQAKRFAELIEQEGWMVITGAGGGIMRAGHHGAKREASFGVAISLPFEQTTNELIADDPKLVQFKYFFTRKLMFVKEANAIILFPGGFGTLDEGFEALTLVQTLKSKPTPIVLCDEPGGTYWQHWLKYVEDQLLNNGMIDRDDTDLLFITDSAEEAVSEIVSFYRCYHSSRYVGNDLVLRMTRALPDSMMEEINSKFSDILLGGRYEQHAGPLPEEGASFPELWRLVFRFNRRSAARLRQLIDRINAS